MWLNARKFSSYILLVSASLALAAPTSSPTLPDARSNVPADSASRTSQPKGTAPHISYESARLNGGPVVHDDGYENEVDKATYNPDFDPFAPRPSATSLQPDVPFTSSDPNDVLWTPTVYKGRIGFESKGSGSDLDLSGGSTKRPEPVRNLAGAAILGPENLPMELQNADALAPPSTDNGQVSNFKWPFSLSHNKIKKGGWARQQNGKPLNIGFFHAS
jgi:hypothetical protein